MFGWFSGNIPQENIVQHGFFAPPHRNTHADIQRLHAPNCINRFLAHQLLIGRAGESAKGQLLIFPTAVCRL
jgi:hypothetical protein